MFLFSHRGLPAFVYSQKYLPIVFYSTVLLSTYSIMVWKIVNIEHLTKGRFVHRYALRSQTC